VGVRGEPIFHSLSIHASPMTVEIKAHCHLLSYEIHIILQSIVYICLFFRLARNVQRSLSFSKDVKLLELEVQSLDWLGILIYDPFSLFPF
jgi:hypothetical protein